MKFLLFVILMSSGLLVTFREVQSADPVKESNPPTEDVKNPVDDSKSNDDKPIKKSEEPGQQDNPVQKNNGDKNKESKKDDTPEKENKNTRERKRKNKGEDDEKDKDEEKVKKINQSLILVKKLKCKELKNIQKNIKGNNNKEEEDSDEDEEDDDDDDDEEDDDDDEEDYYDDMMEALLFASLFRKKRDANFDEVKVSSEGSLKLPPSFRYFSIGTKKNETRTSIESPLASFESKEQKLGTFELKSNEENDKTQAPVILLDKPNDGDLSLEKYGKDLEEITVPNVFGIREEIVEEPEFIVPTEPLNVKTPDHEKKFIGPLDYENFREAYYRPGFVGPIGPGGYAINVQLRSSGEPVELKTTETVVNADEAEPTGLFNLPSFSDLS